MSTTRCRAVVSVLVALATVFAVTPAGSQAGPAGTDDWTAVETGAEHTCGIRDTGRLYCWGRDQRGQLGNGPGEGDQLTPFEVDGAHTDWVSVSAGAQHTCGRRASGRLYCWGSDDDGQLGEGPGTADQQSPVQVVGGHTDWRRVSAGGSHTCGRRATGRGYCWGSDGDGQLGEGPGTADQQRPVELTGGVTTWSAVSAGSSHSCATRTGGRLYCWGNDRFGQTGEGAGTHDQQNPVEVNAAGSTWAGVAAGNGTTCARRTTRRLYCWGLNDRGQLAVPVPALTIQSPTQVTGNHTNWGAIDVGIGPCGLRGTGRLYCATASGLIEEGEGFGDWTSVTIHLATVCGRRASGRLFCYGENGYGQAGDGTTVDPVDPVEVAA